MYNLNSTVQLIEQEIYAITSRKEALENEKASLIQTGDSIDEEVKLYESQYTEVQEKLI